MKGHRLHAVRIEPRGRLDAREDGQLEELSGGGNRVDRGIEPRPIVDARRRIDAAPVIAEHEACDVRIRQQGLGNIDRARSRPEHKIAGRLATIEECVARQLESRDRLQARRCQILTLTAGRVGLGHRPGAASDRESPGLTAPPWQRSAAPARRVAPAQRPPGPLSKPFSPAHESPPLRSNAQILASPQPFRFSLHLHDGHHLAVRRSAIRFLKSTWPRAISVWRTTLTPADSVHATGATA